MNEVESLNDIQKRTHGGSREGAGRPKHSKNPDTIQREEAAKQFKERVAKNVDRLFNAQLDKALGEKYLMVITTTGEGAKQRRETTIVTDPETIKDFLDSDEDPKFGEDNEYYFISTKPADNMALDSLLNRSFGRATEKIELEHSGEISTGETDPKLAAEFASFLKQKKD
jgi:Mg2+ and Co2+ transporter CorA